MDPSLQHTLDQVITSWKTHGVACNPGVSDTILLGFEQALAFSCDPAFAAYLRQVNGFTDFDWDEAMFSFWSTERIAQEAAHGHPAELLCFADHCINLGSFGFRRRNDPKIYLHYQHQEGIEAVADSFHDFLKIYLLDPFSLLK
jgi:hypothetical protein